MTVIMMWTTDALVLAALLILTAAVAGMARVRRFGIQLHAAAKAASLGIVPLLVAAVTSGDGAMIGRAALVLAVLLVTTPVAVHALARAAYRRRRRRARPGSRP